MPLLIVFLIALTTKVFALVLSHVTGLDRLSIENFIYYLIFGLMTLYIFDLKKELNHDQDA